MKNILVEMGGGRPKGNAAQFVNAFVKGAEEAGHSVEKVSLNDCGCQNTRLVI